MYAMILAAGRGERLRPLTDSTPKPLLKVGPCMLIEHHLHALSAAGIYNVVINIGHLGDQIIDRLGDGSRYQLAIQYSDERNAVLETGGGIVKAIPLLKSDPFLVINGDIWTDINLSSLDIHADSLAHLVLVKNPDHNLHGDFCLHDGKVQNADSCHRPLTYSGMAIFRHAFFDQCKEQRFPLAPLLRKHIEKERVSGQVYDGQWFDIGTKDRLDEINSLLAG